MWSPQATASAGAQRRPALSFSGNRQLRIAAIFCLAVAPHVRKLFLSFPTLFSGYLPDDAFYYYKTAIHIRQGLGPTFDGQNWTNGFHPLWMAVCTLVAFLTTDPNLYLHLIIFTNLAFVVGFSFLLYATFEKELGAAFALVSVFAVNCNYPGSAAVFSGLETPLYLMLLLIVIRRVDDESPLAPRSPRAAVLGILFALAFYARTDFVLVAPLALLLLLIRQRRAAGWNPAIRTTLAVAGMMALLAIPYLLYNLVHTGHVQQISGLVKDLHGRNGGPVLPIIIRSLRNLGGAIRTHVSVVDAILIALLLLSLVRVRSSSIRRNPRVVLLTCMGIVVFTYYVVSYRESLRAWQCAAAYVAGGVILAKILQCGAETIRKMWPRAGGGGGRILPAALAVLLMGALVMKEVREEADLGEGKYHFGVNIPYQDLAAKWIAANTPEGARIGVWNAGYVGYFSNRSVVNLDGLINGPTLYEYLRKDGGVWKYIVDQRLDYISDYYFGAPEPPLSPIGSRLTLVHSVGRSDVDLGGGKRTFVDWYVWKVDVQVPPAEAEVAR